MANNLGALNKQILLKLLLLAVLMFGFGYALVPLYKALCEVTGINVVTSKNNYGVRAYGASKPGNTQVDYSRTITIEFDSNSRGPFAFKPVKNFLEVHPGEMHEIVYEVVNTLDRPVAAQAIPSYAPKTATEFFTKIECFCFQEQALTPHQIRQMPVVFIVDPNLPKDVKTITLSYTFFETGIPKPVANSKEPKKKVSS
ncbi:cytochrome c oxidase assembly protein [Polynucleobacter acidiphobus]|jgi:cytochrome c oxidase assembly protein subunit 11|uniref:cytochrome c oxidase assembly protein n=1 Tax=Polynucleobacter acidiphobus TaxID=556053 RepID=UPI000D3743B7|nr:cytochrome c oxidase assembly protein [Polynucleobacter acidiphobus]